jgi:hypothetical protein
MRQCWQWNSDSAYNDLALLTLLVEEYSSSAIEKKIPAAIEHQILRIAPARNAHLPDCRQ